ETPEMYKVPRIIIKKHDEFNDGLFLYLEVTIEFGYPINEGLRKFKEKVIKEIEKLTAMNVLEMKVVVKDVHYKKQGEEE
ncbi:MAG: Asp23/Gls24 family envelope stress response protein, partial [Clostridia bacterium]|nr:Asp23/Gls24 family envelope stress response protein [Clostridia bacterium]